MLRRPMFLTGITLAVLVLGMLVAFGMGADGASLVLGGALVAFAFSVVVGLWLRPMAQQSRQQRQGDERKARQRAGRTRAAVHMAERRLYSQLEALAWLRDELRLRSPLPPTRGAAAAPDALLELIRIIDHSGPGSVLELGSGVSTIVCARRMQQAGRGHIVALEHDAEYAAATRAQLITHGLQVFATVVDARLVEVRLGDDTWSWYQLGPEVPERIDALFVDGPPMTTGRLARYPALPRLRERLAPGASILVDDGDRPDEREMVRRWEAEIEGLEARYLPLTKGAWLLTIPDER